MKSTGYNKVATINIFEPIRGCWLFFIDKPWSSYKNILKVYVSMHTYNIFLVHDSSCHFPSKIKKEIYILMNKYINFNIQSVYQGASIAS
jgi:hypothetical protein